MPQLGDTSRVQTNCAELVGAPLQRTEDPRLRQNHRDSRLPRRQQERCRYSGQIAAGNKRGNKRWTYVVLCVLVQARLLGVVLFRFTCLPSSSLSHTLLSCLCLSLCSLFSFFFPLQNEHLLAYQIAFDLVENSTQQFLQNVRNLLPSPEKSAASSSTTTATGGESMDVDKTTETTPLVTQPQSTKSEEAKSGSEGKAESAYGERMQRLKTILSGETSIGLYLDFLFRNNKTGNTIAGQAACLFTTRCFFCLSLFSFSPFSVF